MTELDLANKTQVADSDGEDGKPDTWSRWEAEYCSTHKAALRCAADRVGPRKFAGEAVIDRKVSAKQLARAFEGESEIENGLYRVLYGMVEHR